MIVTARVDGRGTMKGAPNSGEHERAAGAEPLAHVVERQRRENEHLRAALRTRAVIEQAKGILVARTGADPESAFKELVAYSQRSNRKLVRVAAELVAHTITSPGRGKDVEAQEQVLREATAWDATTLVTAAAVLAAPDLDELLEAIIQHTRRLGVTAGMLALAEPDGALRIVGMYGYESHVVSGWQRIPPGTDLPVSAAAEQRRALWLRDRAQRESDFAGAVRFPGHREACVAVPLEVDRHLVGVLCLDWDEPDELDEDTRAAIESVAALCADPVAQLLRDYDEELPGVDFEPGRSGWFWAFLDSQPVPELVLDPQMQDEHVIDLEVLHANREARELTDLAPGDSLLERYPALAEGGLLAAVDDAVRSGQPVRVPEDAPPAEDQALGPMRDLTVARVGTSIVVSWSPSKA
jgi:putative methionine-R-sulfoxide reductase with GAF domain